MAKADQSRSVRLIGGLGYFSCILQWLWLVVLFLPILLQNEVVHNFLVPPTDTANTSLFSFHMPPLLAITIGIIVTVIMLAISVVLFLRLPFIATQTTQSIVHTSAEQIVKTTHHSKPLPAKKRRLLTVRYMLLLKIALTLLPLLLLIIGSTFMNLPLENVVAWTVGIFFASWTVVWFCLQYFVALAKKVSLDTIY